MCKKPFKARVFSGKKEGEFFVSLYSKNIKNTLGFIPYPGTLNAKLISDIEEFNQCLSRSKVIIIDPPNIPNTKFGRVYAYPITIFNSFSSYILRPEITIYNKEVIEIISDKKLRDLLNLDDGSIIEVSILIE